jgi:hypothetical protein
MRRFLLFVGLILLIGGAVLIWQRLRTPTAPAPEAPRAPEVRREPPLQADAEGFYIPGYRFTVAHLRFSGFRLRPVPSVSFVSSGGIKQSAGCLDERITAEAVHLRCDSPQVGIVTIDGRFLIRSATNRLDVPVVAAVVTVRSASGETLYSARDQFVWQPDEE